MAASATDKFTLVGNPGTATTLAVPGHTIAGTTFNVVSTSNWPTTTGVVFAVDTFTTQIVNGVSTAVRTPGSYTEWEGVVASSTQITGAVLRYGTDQNYSAGASTRVYIPVASQWVSQLISGLLVAHNQDGTLAANAITSASQITDGIVGDAEMSTEVKPVTRSSESSFDYIASGCVITGTGLGTTLGWSMTAGVVYIGGKRFTVASASGTVTASKDTYFDLLDPGSGTVATLVNTSGNIVANNAASPALAASSVRAGIVVSAATIAAAASINQGQEDRVLPVVSLVAYSVTDSLGNLICPRDPSRKLLGYKQAIIGGTTTNTTATAITPLSVPIIVPTGRKVKVSLVGVGYNDTAGKRADFTVWVGTVGSGTKLFRTTGVSGGGTFVENSINGDTIYTPSSSSITINAAYAATNSGGAFYEAAAGEPFSLKIELY